MIPVYEYKSMRGTRNDIAVYDAAFLPELSTIWTDTKFSQEISNMAFERAHACFLRDNVVGETQRRELLYAYMSYMFYAEKAHDDVNKTFGASCSDNLYVKRAIRNLCIAYNEPPDRTIDGDNGAFKDLLTAINYDTVLQKAYRIQKLINEVLIMPMFTTRHGKSQMVLRYYTPDMYAVEYDALGDINELWLPYFVAQGTNGKVNETHYLIIDKQRYYVLDSQKRPTTFVYNGEEVSEVIHPYGRVPAVVLSLDGTSEVNTNKALYGGGMYELIKAQLDCNQLETCIKQNYIYSGFAQWIYYNFGAKVNDVIMGPGRPVSIDSVRDIEGADVPPTIDVISPTDHYTTLEELKQTRMRSVLRNYGLPTSLLFDNPGIASSGVAMRIDRIELEEARKEDIPILKANERELLEMIRLVANTDVASPYKGRFPKEYEVNIDYAETSKFIEPVEEYEYYKGLYNDNLITVYDYVKIFSGKDGIANDEDAIAYIRKNQENKLSIGEVQNAQPAYEGDGIGTGGDDGADQQVMEQPSVDIQAQERDDRAI